MLRQISKILLVQNSTKLVRPTIRSFSATQNLPALVSTGNHNYKWMFTALGCFGIGYLGNKLLFVEKKQPVEIKPAVIEKTEAEIKPVEVIKSAEEKTVESTPTTSETAPSIEFTNLITEIKNCGTPVDLEKVLYGKDINSLIGDFKQLDTIFGAIYLKKKHLGYYGYQYDSTGWLNDQHTYFLSYLDDSIRKHVNNWDQLETLLNHNISQARSHLIDLIRYKIPNMIDSYEKLDKMCSSNDLLNCLPNKQIHNLFFSNVSSTTELRERFKKIWVSPFSSKRIISTISDSELRNKIVVNSDILKNLLNESGPYYKYEPMDLLNRLGREHIQNLLSNLPPLQIEAMMAYFPQSYIAENISLFESVKKEALAHRTAPRP